MSNPSKGANFKELMDSLMKSIGYLLFAGIISARAEFSSIIQIGINNNSSSEFSRGVADLTPGLGR
ncbi:MAG: hypothetical protein ACPHOK_00590, partial [Akkermansiaceae bacterium]